MSKQRRTAGRTAGPSVRDSCERIGVELGNLLQAFAPSDEVLAHFRAARVEVLKGLEPGMKIVRTGHQKLFEGAKVFPVTNQNAAPTGNKS